MSGERFQEERMRTGIVLTSPWLMAAVLLPPALCLLTACVSGGMTLAEACSARTFQGYVILTAALFVYRAACALLNRSYSDTLLAIGMLFFLLQGTIWYCYRFNGEAGAGAGDQIVDYHRQEAGPLSGDTRIPARVEVVPAKSSGELEFAIDAERVQVPLNKSFTWKDFRLTPIAIEWAPMVTVRTTGGTEVETLYFKMGTVAPQRDFFLIKTLPHRIYVTPDGSKGIKLRIIRNKVVVTDTAVVWGEQLSYDDHAITFDPGAPWVRIRVERQAPHWPALAGVTAFVLAAIVALKQRKKTETC